MKKEKHSVTTGFLRSTTKICCTYDLDCFVTETDLYYKLQVRYENSKKEFKFGTVEEAMDYIRLLAMTYGITFKTWELLNYRLAK